MKQNRTVRLIGRCGALALATVLSCGAFAACSKDKDTDPDAGKATGTVATTEEVTTADPHQKTFTSAGMTITLSDDFQKSTVPGYTVGFESDDAMLLALVESDDALKDYTLDQYANKVISNNASLKGKTVKHDEGLTYFEFESTVDGVTYKLSGSCLPERQRLLAVPVCLAKEGLQQHARGFREVRKDRPLQLIGKTDRLRFCKFPAKFLQKGVDKRRKVCYNNTERRNDTQRAGVNLRLSVCGMKKERLK